jgi:hypothetical protein
MLLNRNQLGKRFKPTATSWIRQVLERLLLAAALHAMCYLLVWHALTL